MIFMTVVIFLCMRVGDLAPLLDDQHAQQSSALKYFYPTYQQTYLQNPYQQSPYIIPQYAYQPLPKQSTQNPTDNVLLKQQTFPANVISSIPFLPIHINIPDLIQSIIKGLQSVFGTNLPIIGNPTIISPNIAQGMMSSDPSFGMYNNLKFIPIIILVPQSAVPMQMNPYEGVELKT